MLRSHAGARGNEAFDPCTPSMSKPGAQRSGEQHLDSVRQPPAGQKDLSLGDRAGGLDVLLADFLNIFGNLAVELHFDRLQQAATVAF